MGHAVILTPQSLEDLELIVSYIAKDNPEKAISFGNLLIDKALSLGQLPDRGRVVREVGDPAVRELVHGSYRIIYEIYSDPAAVYILRFWHAARGEPDVLRT